MPWPKTGATQYHAQLGLPDKGRAIKGLVVVNSWDLEPLNLLNCQPFLGYDKYLVALRKFYLFVGNEQRQFISKDIPCGQT